jgi:ABC-type transport system involved in multi-copper enzyme maturation permease subunit
MNFRSNTAILGQLGLDTFRQARASGIFWMMLAVTAVGVLLCLSVRITGDVSLQSPDETVYFLPQRTSTAVVPDGLTYPKGRRTSVPDVDEARREGVEVVRGRMTLAFGAIGVPISRERADAVHLLELILGWGVAGTAGLLMTLVWTAGFVPAFLEPNAASVLLAKPVARWLLLLGKYLGVVSFVAFQVALFVASTWLALGLRTGVWDTSYWWCVPQVLVQFAIFYGFSVLLAVLTRSTIACVFGSVVYWLLSWGVNYARIMVRVVKDSQQLPSITVALTDAAYWIFPKPVDAGLMLFNSLDARRDFEKPLIFKLLEPNGAFSPTLSLVSSFLLTGLLLALAAHELNAIDY